MAWIAIMTAALRVAEPVPPPDAQELPAVASDHVVARVREGRCCGHRRRTITRSGSWVRDERLYADRSETSYSDFASGTSLRIWRDSTGEVQKVAIERSRSRRSSLFIRRTPTGRRDTALGEPCTIWSLAAEGYRLESCETADGIQLWRRHPSPRDGSNLSSEDAVLVERRPVRPDEVRPPADFFRLMPPIRTDAATGPDSSGYEVRLVSRGSGRAREQVRRESGSLASGHFDQDGMRSYWGSDGATAFSYRTDGDGVPISLEISRIDTEGPRPVPARWEPVPGRRPRSVLGERCTWQQRADIRSTDIRHECRTADGIALMTFTDPHWDSRDVHYRATHLSRGPLARGAFAVPAAALDWAAWGVAPPS